MFSLTWKEPTSNGSRVWESRRQRIGLNSTSKLIKKLAGTILALVEAEKNINFAVYKVDSDVVKTAQWLKFFSRRLVAFVVNKRYTMRIAGVSLKNRF